MLIVPAAVALIFALLHVTFLSLKQALLVIGTIPFALAGGIAALWVRGMNLNLRPRSDSSRCLAWPC